MKNPKTIPHSFSNAVMKHIVAILMTMTVLASCSTQQKIGKSAQKLLIRDSALASAHLGIAVQDPATGTFLYKYQSDKFFTPASNTKIFTCYASMKTLPERLPSAWISETDTAMVITPAGDPSFLHPEFSQHPLFEVLKKSNKTIVFNPSNWKSLALGSGWSWNDYSEYYMTERSAFPVYGNTIQWYQEKTAKENPTSASDTTDAFIYSDPEVSWPVDFGKGGKSFSVQRDLHRNAFTLHEGKEKSASVSIPYITHGIETGLELLEDSLHKPIYFADEALLKSIKSTGANLVYSQFTDTLLRNMMHRSDNFYADQCLLMTAQLKLNALDEAGIIRDLLQHELSGLPQSPRWVDGSGLSRYNQFSPEDLIHVLNLIKNEQPWSRITALFPSNGKGTLSGYQKKEDEFIYAKTGSLSGVSCLSGYVKSRNGKWLTFSIMINNHNSSGAVIRKKMEQFLQTL